MEDLYIERVLYFFYWIPGQHFTTQMVVAGDGYKYHKVWGPIYMRGSKWKLTN